MARGAKAATPSLAAFATGLFAALLLWSALFALRGGAAHDEFDVAHLARWELGTLTNKWVFAVGEPLRDDPPGDEAIAAWFALRDRDSDEARRLENVAEAAIEGRVDAAIREQGLSFPLTLPGPLAVWPPLDIELTPSPHVLIISPRTEIRRQEQRILQLRIVFLQRQAADDLFVERPPVHFRCPNTVRPNHKLVEERPAEHRLTAVASDLIGQIMRL